MTSTVTTEFRSEYEQELSSWLRRRFLWYTSVVMGFGVLGMILGVASVVLFVFVLSPAQLDTEHLGTNFITLQRNVEEPAPEALVAEAAETIEQRDTTLEDAGISDAGSVAEGSLSDDSTSELGGSSTDPPSSDESDQPGDVVAASSEEPTERQREYWRLNISNQLFATGSTTTSFLLYLFAFLKVKRSVPTREELIQIVTRLIIIAGMVNVAFILFTVESYRFVAPSFYEMSGQGFTIIITSSQGVAAILVTHLIASLFLPWTPRESIKPIAPLILANLVLTALYAWDRPAVLAVTLVAAMAAGVPGLIVSWVRRLRFRRKFHFKMLKGRYGEMKRELLDARRLHESLFPAQLDGGPVSVRYSYEPMREIGGDFLYTKREGDVAHIVLIDVTGHGVGAALTVNRLHGELERRYGIEHDPSPESVLAGLNEYLHFALASHSVYATALCIRVNSHAGTIEHASAGHPPAFLRTADGRMDRLESTTLVLGVVHPDDFEANPERNEFMRGDALIAYTDGATEAVTASGKMIRVDGLERIAMKTAPRSTPSGVASRAGHSPNEQWCDALLSEVERLRMGPTLDDTLVVEVRRPI